MKVSREEYDRRRAELHKQHVQAGRVTTEDLEALGFKGRGGFLGRGTFGNGGNRAAGYRR